MTIHDPYRPAYSGPSAGLRIGPPWEQSLPFLGRFFQTVQHVLGQPTAFYSTMRREGGLGAPFVFALIGMIIGFIATLVYQVILTVGMAVAADQAALLPVQLAAAVGWVIGGLLFQILGLFVFAGIMHLGLKMVGGGQQSYETTFRVLAYTTGPTSLLQLVPFCGGLVGGIWGLVIVIIGLARAHETTGGKAAFAGLLPVVVCGCLGGVFLVLLGIGLAGTAPR